MFLMVALQTPAVDKNFSAPDFDLLSVDGKRYSLSDIRMENGLVVAFICNHCPYVKAIAAKIRAEAEALSNISVGFVCINPNDAMAYPEDSYENMKIFADHHGFSFPYLFDENQVTAKKYNAVCTPDFFGFNSDLKLRYRGRLDSAKKEDIPNAKRELFEAMSYIAKFGDFIGSQVPSIGCSIKWRSS